MLKKEKRSKEEKKKIRKEKKKKRRKEKKKKRCRGGMFIILKIVYDLINEE